MSITVTAKERGFYGTVREPGDRFDIASEADLGRWMEAEAQPHVTPHGEWGPSEAEAQPQSKPGKK